MHLMRSPEEINFFKKLRKAYETVNADREIVLDSSWKCFRSVQWKNILRSGHAWSSQYKVRSVVWLCPLAHSFIQLPWSKIKERKNFYIFMLHSYGETAAQSLDEDIRYWFVRAQSKIKEFDSCAQHKILTFTMSSSMKPNNIPDQWPEKQNTNCVTVTSHQGLNRCTRSGRL